jgi:hypothetical protein|tara:strand:+ start:962 stop:1111 length:150 start_codon:yes stop_codon:yes gene_type:complete
LDAKHRPGNYRGGGSMHEIVESLPIVFVGSIFLILSLSLGYQYIRAKFA